jgi:hypothetical protein
MGDVEFESPIRLLRALRLLPTKQVVIADGLTLRFSLWPSLLRRSHLRSRRPCPPRARSIGNWRSLTVNNGRSHTELTCAIRVASGRDDGPDAPSKLVNPQRVYGP